MSLTFAELSDKAWSRSLRWLSARNWSPSDWAVAVAGEAGELCNAVKKWNRVRDGMANLNEPGRRVEGDADLRAKVGEELADVVIYAPSMAAALGIDLEAEVVRKFDSVSELYGFPERLGVAAPVATHVDAQGVVRQDHYGVSRQPWDTIKARSWAPHFCGGNILKYMRRSKEPAHSLESARWYLERLREIADRVHGGEDAAAGRKVLRELYAELTADERERLGW